MCVLQYAGNVLVYGPASPCDGDWYGGVTADGAEAFLDALMAADVGGQGGVGSAPLRPLWRGRMGLSKAEQLQVWCTPSAISAAWKGQPAWRSRLLALASVMQYDSRGCISSSMMCHMADDVDETIFADEHIMIEV